MVYKQGSFEGAPTPTRKAHVVIGLIVVILGTLNPFVALVRPHPVDQDGSRTFGRRLWELVHKYLIGWTAVVGGLVNCVVAAGMLLTRSYNYDISVPVMVLTILVVEAVFALALYGRTRYASGKAGTKSWSRTVRESELSAVAGALDVLIEQDANNQQDDGSS